MARFFAAVPLVCAVLAPSARAQQYELGADFGYGFYRNGSIYSDVGSAKAGIRSRDHSRQGFFALRLGRISITCTTTAIRSSRRPACERTFRVSPRL